MILANGGPFSDPAVANVTSTSHNPTTRPGLRGRAPPGQATPTPRRRPAPAGITSAPAGITPGCAGIAPGLTRAGITPRPTGVAAAARARFPGSAGTTSVGFRPGHLPDMAGTRAGASVTGSDSYDGISTRRR